MPFLAIIYASDRLARFIKHPFFKDALEIPMQFFRFRSFLELLFAVKTASGLGIFSLSQAGLFQPLPLF
jgi:hypothetical protein